MASPEKKLKHKSELVFPVVYNKNIKLGLCILGETINFLNDTYIYIYIHIYIILYMLYWNVYIYNDIWNRNIYIYIYIYIYIKTCFIYIYIYICSSLMQISLNIIDILCLHIFFWIRSNSRITFIVFGGNWFRYCPHNYEKFSPTTQYSNIKIINKNFRFSKHYILETCNQHLIELIFKLVLMYLNVFSYRHYLQNYI